ncbi:hypothetical protein [Neorhizobium sp. DT-125]|uniref:hypothetical protein n=1 Tax=Neorhizobium sp. DT-125 TaxID=3396163 RepID=UPI003F1E017B
MRGFPADSAGDRSRFSMPGGIDGQSRKTDRNVERRLNSTWAVDGFEGRERIMPFEGRMPAPPTAVHLRPGGEFFDTPEFAQATVHGSCIAICVVLLWSKNRGTRLWHLMKC